MKNSVSIQLNNSQNSNLEIFDMMTVNINTHEITHNNQSIVATNYDNMLYMKIKLNVDKYVLFEKIYMTLYQTAASDANFVLYECDENYNINYSKSTKLFYTQGINGYIRYIDLSSFILNDVNGIHHFAILPAENETRSLRFYSNSSSGKNPYISFSYYDDYEFYKEQKYIEGTIHNCHYSINIRNGLFHSIYNMYNTETLHNPLSINLVYNI